ncbi:MAG: 5-(carboxyamino)imidazole ribonucleotide mutase [Methanobacteriaceae archaeon]
MDSNIPKVMIILGSASDKKIAEKSVDILEKLKIHYTVKVASAHRTHDKVKKLVVEGEKAGVEVFIGIAGLAAHLPGSIAAYTSRPVIGVPVDVKLGGIDALYAEAQMPFPAPVATVGIDRGDNGAILAGQIIATKDNTVKEGISKIRNSYFDKIQIDEINLVKEINDSIDGGCKYFNSDFLKEISEEENPNLFNNIEFKSPPTFPNSLNIEEDEKSEAPLVSIVPGSYSDMETAKGTILLLEKLGIPYDLSVISPMRHPDRFKEYVDKMESVKVFIAISGLSAHVAGSIVALSEKPVIGVPCPISLDGKDSLLSMANMPPGVPVGTVGIGNGKNGAMLAGQILALSDIEIDEKVKRVKSQFGN